MKDRHATLIARSIVDAVSRLAASSYAWETVEREISKCEVRCANCHIRKTAKQFEWKFKK